MNKTDPYILAALEIPGWYERRVFPKVDKGQCWIWTGSKAVGYGMVHIPNSIAENVNAGVHRVVWIHERGPIADSLVLDHDGPRGCHNRACCDPGHLQAVTFRHNIVVTGGGPAYRNSRKTHCPKGHRLAGENLLPAQIARGSRDCATCHADRYALRMAAARMLGLSQSAYLAEHGYTTAAAERVLASELRAA
jgi:hypothetical protein